MALLVDFGGFNLESGIEFGTGRFDDCLLFLNLTFDDTEEEVDNTDGVEFFVLIKVDESKSTDFGFTSPNSLNFDLNKINIFFHNKVINGLVSHFTLILLMQFLNDTQHFMSASLHHVLVIDCRNGVGEVFHLLVVQ